MKKRQSPFNRLTREVEAYLAQIIFEAQLGDIRHEDLNEQFFLGQFTALRFILERAYAIAYSRSIGCELDNLSPAAFLQEFRAARNRHE